VTAFLRTNRYASVLITTIILVVVGLIVNLTRSRRTSSTAPWARSRARI
jgi:hypothetical protein